MIQEEAKDSMSHFIFSFKLVFSNWVYCIIAGSIASVFWIVFNVFDQLLFFSPIVTILSTTRCGSRFYSYKYNVDTFRHCCEHEHICIEALKIEN